MNNICIYFSDDSELSEYEAISKGYRVDVYARVNESTYNLSVYALIRLQQDFEEEYRESGFYSVDANLVLVKEANKAEILNTLTQLKTQGYFEKIKPMTESIDVIKLVQVQ